MKRIALALIGLSLAGAAAANEGALPYRFEAKSDNLPSVQRGAANFMNYCSGCHSMRHLRYNRIGKDLGISDDLLKSNLMFTSDKIGDHILSSMPAQASAWFGQQPPDLSLEARMRGADWVYNYLMTFYVDDKRPLGVNNLVLPNASMPAVLWELQGWQVKEAAASEGEGEGHGPPLKLEQPGKLSPDEYKKFVADTVNFLAYAAEPGKAMRVRVGMKVMLYLVLFTVLCYLLKKEWWRDVH
jgi:ubiquinol-cytochrome c reductase cytochrome c1 subunit